jgi:hypothetical protein
MKQYRLIKLLVLASCALLVTGCSQPLTNSMDYSEFNPETLSEIEADSGVEIDPYDILGRLQVAGGVTWAIDPFANSSDIPVESIFLSTADLGGSSCAVWVFADESTVNRQVELGNFDWMSENSWWSYGADGLTGKGILLSSNLRFGNCVLQANNVFDW